MCRLAVLVGANDVTFIYPTRDPLVGLGITVTYSL